MGSINKFLPKSKSTRIAQERAKTSEEFLKEYNLLRDKYGCQLNHKMIYTDKGIRLDWCVEFKEDLDIDNKK